MTAKAGSVSDAKDAIVERAIAWYRRGQQIADAQRALHNGHVAPSVLHEHQKASEEALLGLAQAVERFFETRGARA